MIKRLFLLLVLAQFSGCASVQYKAMEKVGVHKRDILINKIESARDSQAETKIQVVSTYEQFKNLVMVNDGGLEKRYKAMAKAVERSQDRATELDHRIDAVESVAGDLFSEWKSELGQYSSAALREASAKNLLTTRSRYDVLVRRMRTAQSRVTPVLHVLQDHTLYLKHNLNARAVSSLQSEVAAIESKVGALVSDMEVAITEAEKFIQGMNTGH
ncbi:MAG TPA: DUF2959 domain-containing protein [Gammaproteobacteria bacterium]|jgi:outer membrane murein-binding lipoprotein Lpp|nr:DUF2959 domain-containing protein [Gammaproteobacteria bacterium]